MNKRAFAVLVVVVASALSGCKEPEFPKLAAGSDARLYERYSKVIRAETRMGDGLAGSDMQMVPVGTPVMVMEDARDEMDGKRPVRATVLSGEFKDLVIVVPREKLRGK